jgi:glycosyltransferase involved in cell wall biosynthesis
MIAVSRLVKEKGREDLIDIYYNLKNRGIKDKLYIIGDGPQKVELEERIKELNLEKDVLLLGQKKNPFPWMKNAKLFLHTSYGEGLGLVFIESMISGTPVIAYDCPTGPKDILGKNKYGVLIKTGDKKSFEEEIVKLLDDEERKKRFIDKFMNEKIEEFLMVNIMKEFKKMVGLNI